MEKEKSVDALNRLVVINNDRIEGYKTASKETEETDFKRLFSQFVKTSEWCKVELAKEVVKLSGTPTEGTTTTGKFFRVWMDFKAAVTGNDRESILNSCQYGESVASDTYKDVLDDNVAGFTIEQQSMLRAQYMLLKSDYDKVKNIKFRIDWN